jgi:hypothetical protein
MVTVLLWSDYVRLDVGRVEAARVLLERGAKVKAYAGTICVCH